MKILHIETSSRNCSVAISDGEEILCLCEEVSENYKQSESLHTFVKWALEGAEISYKIWMLFLWERDLVLIPVLELVHLPQKAFVMD